MALTDSELLALKEKARDIRRMVVLTSGWAGGGHLGGGLSQTDLLVVLYHKYLKIDPKKPKWPDRDRFILSKGHGGIGFAPVLADLGYFDPELLKGFNHTGSSFGMHLDGAKVPGVDASTGSLGHGLALSIGLSLGARHQGKDWRTVCMLGDGELCEGSVWEAAMSAAHFKVDNMFAIVDRNKMMIDGPTEEVMALEPLADKWRAFGWEVLEIDGHDLRAIDEAFEKGFAHTGGPLVIIAHTIKGKGVDYMEGEFKWHYGGLDQDALQKALDSIERTWRD